MSIDEKSLKSNKKTRRKIEGLINEKAPKLNEKTKRKTDYLSLCKR